MLACFHGDSDREFQQRSGGGLNRSVATSWLWEQETVVFENARALRAGWAGAVEQPSGYRLQFGWRHHNSISGRSRVAGSTGFLPTKDPGTPSATRAAGDC